MSEAPVKIAAAYLRRSTATTKNPGNDSRDTQEAAVRKLCGDDVVLYVDWGVSGRGDGSKRPEYSRLKADIEAGRVESVCAYSLTRLGRNARELMKFTDLCRVHKVAVRTTTESIDTSTAMGRAMFGMMAVMAELELEQGMERSADARETREARGDAMSRPVYGSKREKIDGVLTVVIDDNVDRAPIIAAYEQAGTVLGAVKILNGTGVKGSRGGSWSTSQLKRVLGDWGIVQSRHPNGRRMAVPPALFGGLLRCHCGTTLTPNRARGQYYCPRGHRDGSATHGKMAVAERELRPWIMTEAARFRAPADVVEMREAERARLEQLDAQRERDNDLYSIGEIDKAEHRRRLAKTKAAMEEAEDAVRTDEELPQAVDWTAPPELVGAVLRALWRHVRLDDQMKPVEADWRHEAWRV